MLKVQGGGEEMERAERSKGLEEDEVECRENVGLDVRCGVRIKMGSTGPNSGEERERCPGC